MKKSFLFVSLLIIAGLLLSFTNSILAGVTESGGYWGVYLENLKEETKKMAEYKGEGVYIQQVVDDSPADQAGIKSGDIVIEVDGKVVTEEATLRKLIREASPGAKMSVALMRKGKKISLSITVGEPEKKEISIQILKDKDGCDKEIIIGEGGICLDLGKTKKGFLGIYPQSMSDQLMEYFGVKGGALVGEVVEESPAAKAGIKAGDIIVEFDNRRVDDAKDLKYFLKKTKPGDKVSIKAIRKGQELKFEVELAKCEDCKIKCKGEECEGECGIGCGLGGVYGDAYKLFLDERKLKELEGLKLQKELEKLKDLKMYIRPDNDESNIGAE